MKIKSLFLAGVLGLSSLSLLSAKSVEVSFASPTVAGSVTLKPGQYKLELKGDTAVFTPVHKLEPVSTPVKVQNGDTKFDATRVEASKQADGDHIKSIKLGGSKTTLVFD